MESAGEIYNELAIAAKDFDGSRWAERFLETARGESFVLDEATMTAWFCNAIMAGYDAGYAKGYSHASGVDTNS